jgi:purine-binding chemotaxis protein CheW
MRTVEGGQICTFFLDAQCFGIGVEDVQEVLRYHEMTTVPRAPAIVSGLINLRGEIVTAIDLRRRLHMEDRAEHELPMNVIVCTDDGPVSLLVDTIGDVLEIDGHAYEAPPETLAPSVRELVQGVYKLDDRLLLVLDTGRTVDFGATDDRDLEIVR